MMMNRARTPYFTSAARLMALALVALASLGLGELALAQRLDPAAVARLERLIETRGFTRGLPASPMPSPDGRRVYFLRSGPTDRYQTLYVMDLASKHVRVFLKGEDLGGPSVISKEEQSRRERQRQTERGITSFQISNDSRWLLVPYSGDLWLVDASNGSPRRLTKTSEPEIDAHLSPDASRVAFLRGQDLIVLNIASGQETVVGKGSKDFSFGAAEFVAQEEMDRNTGHWWAPDSRHLAFTGVSTRDVPRFRVPDFNDPTGEGDVQAYPKAGDPNAVVSLSVADVSALTGAREGTTSPRVLDLGKDWEYLARVDWSPDSKWLWVQTQPRSQQRLDLRRFDIEAGSGQVLSSETDSDWINLHDDLHILGRGDRFLWSTERSGHRHLENHGVSGSPPTVLTSGEWDVVKVLDIDEAHGDVTFTGTKDGVLEQQIYRVPLAGGAVKRLTPEPGWHDASFHHWGHGVYVETFSAERTPVRLRVRGRDGKLLGELPSAAVVPSAEDLGPAAELWRSRTSAGVDLDIRVVRTHASPSGPRVPLIIYVYSGPGAQQIRNAWPGERGLFDGWLADQGFVVARIDGRGVAARGHASEHVFSRRLGNLELQDQVAGVRAVEAKIPEIDTTRVGIWGWSYGGYMTLRALTCAPGVFKVGVSVAPVVDWHGYDTHYTERYLGLPSENAAGYDSSSVLPYVSRLRGHLTLVHGTTDDNVHFRESMQLVRKLVQEGKRFDLMVYPGTHQMESLEERRHLYELVWRSFAMHL